MSKESNFFDRIRVKPDQDRRQRAEHPPCEWPGCNGAAMHRAPKGRGRENEYWRFCLAHVRQYNQSYNFFAGMSTDDIAQYQREAIIGHRPTWKMGMNGGKASGRSRSARFKHVFGGAEDTFGLFGEPGEDRTTRRKEARTVGNVERKALETLGIESEPTAVEIKTRFKALVKQHHPDLNGGDRSSEDRLRDIIQAYNYLKSIGFR